MNAHAHIVVGLGFGDEGKGSAVDYLARLHGASLVVRFNGGPQALHHVVLPDGRTHGFSQFGSAYFVPGVDTYLSHHMLIEPIALMEEADKLSQLNGDNPYQRLAVDENCLVITPFHWWANIARERVRGNDRHGSCARGVGECRGDFLTGKTSIFFKDLHNPPLLKQKLHAIMMAKLDTIMLDLPEYGPERPARFTEIMSGFDTLLERYQEFAEKVTIGNVDYLKNQLCKSVSIFEGAQGVLLDEVYGFAPYNTWTDTTFRNADDLLAGTGVKRTRIGVMRTMMTRHGAGPFPSEDAASAYDGDLNAANEWQGNFRFGMLDFPLLRYAIRSCGHVDCLFVTHLDKIGTGLRAVIRYGSKSLLFRRIPERFTSEQFPELELTTTGTITDILDIEYHLEENIPVFYTSRGPTWADKEERR